MKLFFPLKTDPTPLLNLPVAPRSLRVKPRFWPMAPPSSTSSSLISCFVCTPTGLPFLCYFNIFKLRKMKATQSMPCFLLTHFNTFLFLLFFGLIYNSPTGVSSPRRLGFCLFSSTATSLVIRSGSGRW